MNLLFTHWIPQWYGKTHSLALPGMAAPVTTEIAKLTAIWAVQAALLVGILMVLVFGFGDSQQTRRRQQKRGQRRAAGGDEHRLGIRLRCGDRLAAGLPGAGRLAQGIPNPLVNEAITVTLLAGITGSASGGMSIALAAMSEQFIAAAHAANIPLEVLHRVAAMASGGMDTLPHNGAVITLLAVTGLTHREAYKDIFCITLIKTLAVFVVIGTFYATGIV
jgi:H+/gluconate symporter-like permease